MKEFNFRVGYDKKTKKRYAYSDFMKNILEIVYKLLIPIITIFIGTFFASWLFYQYNSPQIKYYLEEENYGYYQKINDYSFGEIYLINEGRKVDKNISIVLDENISPKDITVSYVSSPVHFKNESGRAFISIDELKPNEGAEVVFKSGSQNTFFSVNNITSESGNVHRETWTKPWWHLSKLQFAILILFTTIGFGIGFVVCLWKNDLLVKKS